MNSMAGNDPEKPAYRNERAETRKTKGTNELYREYADTGSADSEMSLPSFIEKDQHVFSGYRQRSNHELRGDIADQLSKLKIGCKDEQNSTSSGNPPFDKKHESAASRSDSRCSVILAGRLNRKEFVEAFDEDHNILNIAINEADETSCMNGSHYEDSLEVQNEKQSFPLRNEQRISEKVKFSIQNNENVDPKSPESRLRRKPRIISTETVNLPLLNRFAANTASDFHNNVLKDRNDNIEQISSSLGETRNTFDSSITESEKLVTADIRTPNVRALLFIEDCQKSSPQIGVNADTFGSEFVTDISDLSSLGIANGEGEVDNREADICRARIVKRLSQQFREAPTKFTEKLLTMLEESLQVDHKNESTETSYLSPLGPNFSRLTEEFRKICQGYRPQIEDQSVCPELFFSICDPPENCDSKGAHSACEYTLESPLHNFSKLGGGKKVYRKTPKSIYHMSNKTQCNTPNCGNALHRVKKTSSHSTNSPNRALDTTANFEFWENFCYELSPHKQTKSKLTNPETNGIVTHEDLLRKSDQQMAALDESIEILKPESHDLDSTKTSKDCHDHSNLTRQRFLENLTNEANIDSKFNEIEKLLSARIVEKRRKCFEEARKVFTANQSGLKITKNESIEKDESVREQEDKDRFLSTLSACVDYFDHVKTLQNHRNSLQCILECSEGSELGIKESEENSVVNEIAFFNRSPNLAANLRGLKPQPTPKRQNFITQACLYLPGTPAAASFRTPKRSHCRSPSRSISPGGRPSSVVAKKIKSPVSQGRRRSLRAAKPASHARTPRTPSISPKNRVSADERKNLASGSGLKSTPSSACNINRFKSGSESPGLTDVTNTKKRNEIPKFLLTKPSPLSNSGNCQNEIKLDSPKKFAVQKKKYFYTPGKTPSREKIGEKKKYFETPKRTLSQNKFTATSPGCYRMNYNTVQSPVGLYIRGTDPNLIKNVKGKINERMLTPRALTPNPKSKASSPILARSPCRSPKSETSRLKFMLTPVKKITEHKANDILNMALCESNPSSIIGSESTSYSPFPKIFYEPAPCVRMVEDDSTQRRRPKVLMRGVEEKIVYRHEGRLKSAAPRTPNYRADESTGNDASCDSVDISLLHQRPVAKSNHLYKK